MCMGIVSLALAIVMAGSGDVSCLRIYRELRWKLEDTAFGVNMAYSMSIGMLI